ncbi:MNS1 [Symbiodinium sp. KB8]|nr:MNS1 [Symbiodinium sp. KB8]
MAFPWVPEGRYSNAAEARIARKSAEEARVADLEKFARQRTLQAAAAATHTKIAQRRRRNEHAMRASELMFEQGMQDKAKFERQRQRRLQQDESLAIELERRKREEESRRKDVQRICEQDPELRQLQELLKQAYANKELAEQRKEQDAIRREEAKADAAMDAAMEAERARVLEAEAKREAEAAAAKRADAAVVKDQIRQREMQRFVEGEEQAARERAQVDAVVARIAEEERQAAAARAQKQAHTRALIDEFKVQRAQHVEAQRQAERDAELAERQYLEAVAAAKHADLASKQQAYQAIVKEQEARRRQEEEEDRLRWVIVEEEAAAKARAEAAAREAATVEARREMRQAVEAQKRLQEAQRAEEAAREAELVKQFLDRLASARAAAREQFKSDISAQQRERMSAYQAQQAAEERAAAEAAAQEEYRARVVAEARRRLLLEHATALEGYLPKGVFKSEEDVRLVQGARRGGS